MKPFAVRRLKRWTVLVVALLATAAVGCGEDASEPAQNAGRGTDTAEKGKEPRDVTALLRFTRGEYAHLFVAQEKGYFADEGVNVTFEEGKGAVFESVASRGGDGVFIISAVNGVTEAVTNAGLPLLTVATWEPASASVLVSRPDKPLTSPKDLEGRTIGVKQGLSIDLMLQTFLKRNDVDPSKVKVRRLDPAAANSVFIGGDVDVVDAFLTNEVPILEAQAKQRLSTLRVVDNGVPELGIGAIVAREFAEDDPDAVRAFLRAAHKGIIDMKNDPRAAAKAIKSSAFGKGLPSEDIVHQQILNTIELMPEPGDGHMYGWAEAERWQTMAEHQKDSGVIKKDLLPVERYFTNDYLE